MNERIRELVQQSGGEFWQRLENDVVNPEAYITFDPPQSLEKFAELIVRECMEVCQDQETYDPIVLPYKPSKQFADAIKQHFGVEE